MRSEHAFMSAVQGQYGHLPVAIHLPIQCTCKTQFTRQVDSSQSFGVQLSALGHLCDSSHLSAPVFSLGSCGVFPPHFNRSGCGGMLLARIGQRSTELHFGDCVTHSKQYQNHDSCSEGDLYPGGKSLQSIDDGDVHRKGFLRVLGV